MKKIISSVLLLALSVFGAYYLYNNIETFEQIHKILDFCCGLLCGITIMYIFVTYKNIKINKYKRALEKETISASENSSKVKVLESKIQVLEKALKEAIKK